MAFFQSSLKISLLLSGVSFALAQPYTISTVAGGAPPTTPSAAATSSIGQPQRVTTDGSGNVYFSSGNSVFKMSGGTLTRVAGNSRAGFSGDGGPALNAQLNGPRGLDLDAAGNLYIADYGNHRVRMVTTDGIITTVAGNGQPGYSGDGGPATSAQLHFPAGVAVEPSGIFYIADSANFSIRHVALDGTIITWVGNGYPGYAGDGGAASLANLSSVEDVAIDSSANLYIADAGNFTVRKVTASQTITTLAGNGTDTGDGGQATSALLNAPFAVAVDSSGNVDIAEYGAARIRQVSSKGVITTIAGSGTPGYSGDGSQATKAQLSQPAGLAVDSSGNLYIADLGNNRIRQVSSGNITTVAGNGILNYSGDGAAATSAQLNRPYGVAADAAGNLYIADGENHRVRKVAVSGAITTAAGNGTAGFAGDGGAAGSAQLNHPYGLAVDAAGNLYIADADNHRVREVTVNGNITTVAGNGTPGFAGDGGAATAAQLNSPVGLAVDAAGNLYIAELSNSRIRKVARNGTITTVAGNGVTSYFGDGGQASQAALNGPFGVAVDAAGNLYIADSGNNRIRQVSPQGVITTVAGNGQPGYLGDGGPATSAQLIGPTGVAVDLAGNLYISDASARIRKVSPDGAINTIAGTGSPGYSGDGGLALSAQLNGPSAIATDAAGNLYVADTINNAIRMLKPTSSNTAINAVTNAASNLAGPVAPGEIVVLYGSGLGPAQLVRCQPGTNSGTRIIFGGVPAPLLYVSATQVSAIVPYGISGPNVQVVAQYLGQTSHPVTLSVASSAPALFTLDSSGKGQAATLDTNRVGSVITLFATGAGEKPVLPVTVTIGGQDAPVQYAGDAPGLVAGVMQVNAQIPNGIATGSAVPVILKVGSASSQPDVTIVVGP